MDSIVFIIFRRMRAPLLALVVTYSIVMLGMVLIPGRDAQGNLWHMDFFHAFYFTSFMATTIGFGEVPYEFTDAQRLWATFSIYATVVAWIYSIGTLIALIKDPAFHQSLVERRFANRIKRIRERFYLICGYGETGSVLVEALTQREQYAVVLESNQDRVSFLRMQNLPVYVPALCADGSRTVHLLEAGLKHDKCAGVVALTDLNEVNLKIAITSKLLHKDITVICRSDSKEVEANMASFGTEYIIDPFDTFAIDLVTAFQAPCLYILHEWLTGMSHELLSEPIYPPRDGHWVLCGYGRFGKAVYNRLKQDGIDVVVIESEPDRTGIPPEGCVEGWGTEAVTLQQANIEKAVGLVAGTHDDTNNLSIIMTARELNPDIFIVARQNLRDNQSLVDAVHADMVMHPSRIIANKIRVLLGTPLLYEFIRLAKFQEDAWACQLASRIIAIIVDEVPVVWELKLNSEDAHAVYNAIINGRTVKLGHIIKDPRERQRGLPCIALLVVRASGRVLLPDSNIRLKKDDRLLFCGRATAQDRMEWILQNEHALNYVLTGEARPQGWVWKMFHREKRRFFDRRTGIYRG
jgi:voltage-gated potassium channel